MRGPINRMNTNLTVPDASLQSNECAKAAELEVSKPVQHTYEQYWALYNQELFSDLNLSGARIAYDREPTPDELLEHHIKTGAFERFQRANTFKLSDP